MQICGLFCEVLLFYQAKNNRYRERIPQYWEFMCFIKEIEFKQ